MKIGYFVPEFPGQTHIFFWREMKRLRGLGIEPRVVSTRKPRKSIISHDWAEEAIDQTEYLFPPSPGQALMAIGQFLRCGPAAWIRCLNAIVRAEGVDIKKRIRMLLLVLVGAHLSRLARKEKWEHIHVHSCADAANVAMFAHLVGGIPYSMTLHGPIEDYGPNQKLKWKYADFVIVITQKLLREAHEQLAGYLPVSVPVAPMGVELDTFYRSTPYQPFQGNGPFRVFACGRINSCKGHEYLIRAVAKVRQDGLDASLAIAGAVDSADDRYFNSLKQLVQELDVEDSVEFLSAVSEIVVREHLENAHAFALASLHEPLGVVYMEAMAMETPVIATSGGGVAELITHEVDGLLVPPKSVDELVDAIQFIASDGENASAIGRAGRERVSKSFHSGVSAEVIARHLGVQCDAPLDSVEVPSNQPVEQLVEL